MASDHNMLEINPTPGARTEGDWTDNDPLMGWLQSTMHESQRRSRASRKEERLMYTLIQNDSSSAITHLRCLARDLAAGQSFTPSEQTDAIVSLDAIKRLLAQIPADLLPSPQLPWLNHVDTIMNSDRCVEPLTVPGTLSDLLSHAAAADIDSLECPLTPPTYMDAEDFKRPFTGPGADDLRAHIHDAQKRFSSASYAKVIPILQSSGSGKSRTVLQLGQKELGLMVCVRRSLNRGQVSEPPRDVAAAKWLQRKVSEKDFPIFDETRSLAVWLIALGEQINDLYRSSWESFKSNHVEGTWEAFVEHVGKLLSPVSAISSFASSLTEAMDVDEGTRSRVRDHLLGSIDSRAEELMDHTKFSLHEYKNYNPTAHTGRESGVAEEEAALAARFFQEALSQAFEGLSNFLKLLAMPKRSSIWRLMNAASCMTASTSSEGCGSTWELTAGCYGWTPTPKYL